MTDKIAIIGFGNIASAIVTPLLDNKLIQPENVFCVVKTEKSLENIKKKYKHNINVYRSVSKESKIIWDCQYKLLSIKPQQFNDVSEAHHIKNKDNLIVSILAGVSINRLSQKFPNHRCEGGYKYSNNYWKRFNRDILGRRNYRRSEAIYN